MDNRTRMIRWLKEPIFSKKIDPFINFLLAFAGAMLGTLVYPKTEMPFWQFLLWMIPVAILLVAFLKVVGSVWKSNREQQEMK
ncbi:hypothetical protein QWY22_03795 [Planococcus liqunii]|uniref:hypothetical protein n=1 Tax=Planococcus liqunii TaxID=3058394 RepID=UPI002608E199|nr:hypothetical protein [Planococcus sp. N056]WKA51735.1 hypothetical protein QWY22_03795 [Planococcus sp. N056]